MRSLVWLGPDREVYTVSILEEPFDAGTDTHTLVFQCGRTGWTGATAIDTGADFTSFAGDDLVVLLQRAKRVG
jgi:hypothetical protein